jgi:hypothetical protein
VEKTLNLIVKGTKFGAALAAAQRGIPFVFETEIRASREVVGKTAAQHIEKVARWYQEEPRAFGESGAGFPDGTLLLYGNGKEQVP